MSKPGRIVPRLALGFSLGSRIRVTRSAVTLSMCSLFDSHAPGDQSRSISGEVRKAPRVSETVTFWSCDLPNTEPSIRPIRILRPDAVSKRGDAVDDEAVPGRGVEQHQAAREQEQQRDEQSEQLVEQPARPVPSQPPWRRARFVRDGDLGHVLERLPERDRHRDGPVAWLAVERHAEVDPDRSEAE